MCTSSVQLLQPTDNIHSTPSSVVWCHCSLPLLPLFSTTWQKLTWSKCGLSIIKYSFKALRHCPVLLFFILIIYIYMCISVYSTSTSWSENILNILIGFGTRKNSGIKWRSVPLKFFPCAFSLDQITLLNGFSLGTRRHWTHADRIR